MTSDLLEVRDLSWSYDPRRPVLRGVGFRVRSGERVALIGPNGAGKTTLIKCLNGLLRSSVGCVLLAERALQDYRPRALARMVAYVPQPMSAGLPFAVREFVAMGRYPYGGVWGGLTAEDQEAVQWALRITGTLEFANRRHDTLSGGERQKVMLASALAQRSPLLLLDEPSAFLDPGHQHEIDCILHTVNRRLGVTLVTATHDLNRAVLTSDRVLGLRDGRLLCDASPVEALAPAMLRGLYDARFERVGHPGTGLPMILPRAPEEVAL